MSLIPKFFMEAVLSIGIRDKDKRVQWIGTGFFIVKNVGTNNYLPFIVTNRHVLWNQDAVVIRLKEKDTGNLRILDMPIVENGRKLYSENPYEKIDIAVILINGRFLEQNNLNLSAFDIDEHALTSTGFIAEGGDEGSYIYMLGFPMGLVNVESDTPVCRMGCVARMDAAEIASSKNYLLDVQNFPGNSGSPIISKPEALSIQGTKALDRSALIGIINGYIPYEEKLINTHTKRIVEVRSENSGIAVANPVEYIRDTLEMELIRNYGKDYMSVFCRKVSIEEDVKPINKDENDKGQYEL